jgi:hypothetical protein
VSFTAELAGCCVDAVISVEAFSASVDAAICPARRRIPVPVASSRVRLAIPSIARGLVARLGRQVQVSTASASVETALNPDGAARGIAGL